MKVSLAYLRNDEMLYLHTQGKYVEENVIFIIFNWIIWKLLKFIPKNQIIVSSKILYQFSQKLFQWRFYFLNICTKQQLKIKRTWKISYNLKVLFDCSQIQYERSSDTSAENFTPLTGQLHDNSRNYILADIFKNSTFELHYRFS